MWDPAQYLSFADERSRPFFDLTGRIGAVAPGYVVDLGCGPGQLTARLASRWPAAQVDGVDSSAEMIIAAEQMRAGLAGPDATAADRLSFAVGDVADWEPGRPVDVVVSNAVLQWVPGHLELLPRWVSWLPAAAGSRSSCLATSTSRATRSCASWPARPAGGTSWRRPG